MEGHSGLRPAQEIEARPRGPGWGRLPKRRRGLQQQHCTFAGDGMVEATSYDHHQGEVQPQVSADAGWYNALPVRCHRRRIDRAREGGSREKASGRPAQDQGLVHPDIAREIPRRCRSLSRLTRVPHSALQALPVQPPAQDQQPQARMVRQPRCRFGGVLAPTPPPVADHSALALARQSLPPPLMSPISRRCVSPSSFPTPSGRSASQGSIGSLAAFS